MHVIEREDDVQKRPSKSAAGALVVTALYLLVNGLYWYATSDRKISLLFSLGSSLLLLVIYLSYHHFTWFNETKLYMTVLCCSGLLYMVVFVPFAVPDELYHFQSSYSLSNTLMGGGGPKDPLDVRAGDAKMMTELLPRLQTSQYDQVCKELSTFADEGGVTSVSTGRVYTYDSNPPQLKIASALGITLARLLNLGPYYLLYLGRLFNFASYAILVWLAFRITPVGKGVFAAVSLLPMNLHLAASYSYDVGIMGLSFLLIALCLRAIYREETFGWKEGLEIVATAALLAPCKVVYVLIAVLAFFIPSRRFASRSVELGVKGGCALLVALVLFATRLSSITSNVGLDSAAGELNHRGAEVGHFYTLSDAISDPLQIVIVYVRTLATKGSFYLSTMVGASLGWFQAEIAAPSIETVGLVLILAFATLRSTDDDTALPTSLRIACVSIFVVGLFAIMASMLFGWTFVTESSIEGVQGRYLLPYLPMLLLGLRPNSLRVTVSSGALVVGMLAVANVAYLIGIFATALTLI